MPEGPALGVGVGPVGGAGHPPVIESHDGGMAAVVYVEFHGMTAGEVPGELQQVPHAGAAEPVDALVVVSHHADVAVMAAQSQEDTLLGAGGVLILIADQVPDAGGNDVGGPAVLQ